jgi:ribonuclease BN (tRNA processing enzyme)
MKLTFLGTGSAFTIGADNWQSNMLLEAPSGKKLLIDCGTDIRFSLAEVGLSAKDIDAVYISHPHADHCGGLEWLAFSTYFNPMCKRPRLVASADLVDELWHNTLKGGMGSIQGQIASLDLYFEVNAIGPNGAFVWEGVTFQLVQVIHYMDGFRFVPSYGLMFDLNGKKVFLTTDTQFAPNQIRDFYNMADLIFHDCETSPFKSGVHSHFSDLATLPEEYKGKMWLYHYQPGDLPDAVREGFQGFIVKGQSFE